ncbi:MAG: carbamate kinase, partial [Candidatus Marinimicrobia bacterium]|nr:carbamate kinase [Candidatus Neomarinimicrobiota bacterium]
NYGQPNQTPIKQMTVSDAKRYLDDGQFPKGSMAPKVNACIAFVEKGGERAIISSVHQATSVLKGEAGTEIIPD